MDHTSDIEPQRRTRRRRKAGDLQATQGAPRAAPIAGRLNPLDEEGLARIHAASLDILDRVGMSEAPQIVVDAITAHGGRLTSDGRLLFPRVLVTQAIKEFRRGFQLFGRAAGQDLDLTGAKVHAGSGGASPNIVDMSDGTYRIATLADLYDAARLVDRA